jgi:hypothetical protein
LASSLPLRPIGRSLMQFFGFQGMVPPEIKATPISWAIATSELTSVD